MLGVKDQKTLYSHDLFSTLLQLSLLATSASCIQNVKLVLSLYKCCSHDSLTVKKIYHLDLAWVITLLQQQGTCISYFEIAVPLST